MTLCCAWVGGIINPFQPIVSSSGVFMDTGGGTLGVIFSTKDLSKISGFLGKKARAFNLLVSNLLVSTQHPRMYLGLCILLFFFTHKFVSYLTRNLPLTLCLCGEDFYMSTTLFL